MAAILLTPVVVVVAIVAAWAVDLGAAGGQVVRNVRLAGMPVGGDDEAAVDRTVDHVAARLEHVQVRIVLPHGESTIPLADLGLHLDRDATREAAMAVGRDGTPATRPWRWLAALRHDRDVPVALRPDPVVLRAATSKLATGGRAPQEPSIAVHDGALIAVAGRTGEGIDPHALTAAVARAIGTGDREPVVHVRPTRVAPRFSTEDAARLARRGNAITAHGLELQLGELAVRVPPATLRSWLVAAPGESGLALDIASDAVVADLVKLAPESNAPPVDAGFSVRGASVLVTAGRDGTTCCDQQAASRVLAALAAGQHRVEVPLRREAPARTTKSMSDLGIREVVGYVAIPYAPGDPSGTNVRRAAELLRGAVIAPGGTLSLAGVLGAPTPDRGFVVAADGNGKVIAGGGADRLATALFNAALAAGLEVAEHQNHPVPVPDIAPVYDADLGFPHPDVAIRNPTTHGVLVWTAVDGGQVSVTLYSTKTWTVAFDPPVATPKGACVEWTLTRTRTPVGGGNPSTDRVSALYHPAGPC